MDKYEECIQMLTMCKLAAVERHVFKPSTVILDVTKDSFEFVMDQAIEIIKEVRNHETY